MRQALAVAAVGLFACGSAGLGADTTPTSEAVILDSYSFYRCLFQTAQPVVETPDGLWPGESTVAAPPDGWQTADFDDAAWVRIPGPFFPGRYMAGFTLHEKTTASLALMCLRSTFHVSDPSAVKGITLDLAYRGGVVVYANGTEVTRAHLPTGTLTASTLAEAYPKEAYVKPDGTIIRWGFKDPEGNRDRLALRTRHLRGLAIPSNRLRKGTNVLAIEVHRAPYHEVTLLTSKRLKKGERWFYGRGQTRKFGAASQSAWTTVGVTHLTLTAQGSGITPNNRRSTGFQVWNADPLTVIYDTDYGPAGSEVQPVKIVGARNGRFAGQVVVGRDAPITGLAATVSDLVLSRPLSPSGERGRGKVIPSSAITVRFPQAGGSAPRGNVRVPGIRGVTAFDALAESAPDTVPVRKKEMRGNHPVRFGAVQPVWLTVRVPADAAPGDYRGTVTIKAGGKGTGFPDVKVPGPFSVSVPVHLTVSGWVLPDPPDWRTSVDFVHSPESVALRYGVPLWSDEHFRLMGESLKWLGSVGNKTIYIPLICRTNMGNAETMVRWIRKPSSPPPSAGEGQGGGDYDYDFSVLDRFLDLVETHMGKIPVVCFYVWDRHAGGGYFGRKPKAFDPVRVTRLDPKTGTTEEMQGPAYNTPAAAAFWRPVAAALRQRLTKRGMPDAMMLGIGFDVRPSKEVVAVWKDVLPEGRWVCMSHGIATSFYGVPVGYSTTVWGPRWAPDPAKGHTYGWRREQMVSHFDRDSWRRAAQAQVINCSYLAGERNITGKQRGFGRNSADFWPCLKDKRGRRRSISARYPESSQGQLNIRMIPYLMPGPDGAISTVRFEMCREGVQACEARIFIESALLDDAKRAKLGDDLAARCHTILDERIRALRGARGIVGNHRFIGTGWQDRTRRLFDAAADVARALAADGEEG